MRSIQMTMPPNVPPADAAMGCEEVLDLLHAFIMDELEEEDVRPLLRHLSVCSTCRSAMAEHVKLAGVLRANMPSLTKSYFIAPPSSWH